MSTPEVIVIGRDLLITALLLSLPTLVVSLVVGLAISVLQAATSIQEQTLNFAPRMLALGVVMLLTMSWMLDLATSFTVRMLWQAAEVGR